MQAQWLVEADLRGQSSHGIARLPVLVGRIRGGLLAPNSETVMRWRTESVLAVDGARGFGPAVASEALSTAIERVRQTGIVVVAISNANHLGILSPYVERAAEEGLVAVALTTSEALVHPWGGRVAMVGTNPIAIGVPADPSPFVLDMATGQVSMGRIIHYDQTHQPLEPGWAIDGDGHSTTDASRAREGAISPFGGPKGFALGLAFEVLIGSLTQSALGRDVHGTLDTADVCNKGDLFLLIDPTVMNDGSTVGKISDYLMDVRATPPSAGSDGVRVPGDRATSVKERGLELGLEISEVSWHAALDLAGRDPVSPGATT